MEKMMRGLGFSIREPVRDGHWLMTVQRRENWLKECCRKTQMHQLRTRRRCQHSIAMSLMSNQTKWRTLEIKFTRGVSIIFQQLTMATLPLQCWWKSTRLCKTSQWCTTRNSLVTQVCSKQSELIPQSLSKVWVTLKKIGGTSWATVPQEGGQLHLSFWCRRVPWRPTNRRISSMISYWMGSLGLIKVLPNRKHRKMKSMKALTQLSLEAGNQPQLGLVEPEPNGLTIKIGSTGV